MFNGMPTVFDDKVQNYELYIQRRFFDQLTLLNLAPINQNPVGLFTNYLAGEIETAEPNYTNNGIDFAEIIFGEGKTEHGQTLPMGFMYKADDRLKRKGQYESSLQSFFNGAVVKFADFYEKVYTDALLTNGRANTATLETESTAEDVINNEITLMDEMEYDSNDKRTGYSPTTVLINRRDKLAIDKLLQAEKIPSNFNYIPTAQLTQGTRIYLDTNNPSFTIEKFGEPEYSVIASLEEDGVSIQDLQIPQSFINIKEAKTNRPNITEYYLWSESNLNILSKNGILVVTP